MILPKINSLDDLTALLAKQDQRIHELELANATLVAEVKKRFVSKENLTTKLYDRREMRHKAAQASRDSCTLSDHLPPLLRKDQLLVCYAVLRARRFQRDPCPATHVDHVLTFCTTDSHPVAYYQLRD